jgi:uncharacterized protein (DUF885 family)
MLSLLMFAMAGALARAADDPTPYQRDCAKLAGRKLGDGELLKAFFALSWKHQMTESPEYATAVGYPGQNGRWSDRSEATLDRQEREEDTELRFLKQSIHPSKLGKSDRLSYDLYVRSLEEDIEGRRFHGRYLAISQLGGVHQDSPRILEDMPHATVADFEDAISRLRALPVLVEQDIALLKEGLRRKIVPARITLRDVPDQVAALLEKDPSKNPLLVSFRKLPESIPLAERERLQVEARAALAERDIPAFAAFREFLSGTYLPGTRESVSWKDMPLGDEWYAFQARRETTTKLSPDEIHQLGLSEVARIREEMRKLVAATGFKGDLGEFNQFIRTDRRFFFTEKDELLRRYRDIAKRIDPELGRLFGKLPRTQYGVKPVPEYSEKSQPTAYYDPGSFESGRAGTFFANTYALDTRPSWEMTALTCHEAVPGHHLQISLAEELEGGPEFRKHSFYTAYVEGWGLYAESLCSELGLYEDSYSRYGQLTYELWRAIRLVLDTGIHHLGWSRQQAIDYFKENSAKTEHDITVEVDRYIVWPGQALAYKIGQLKISALRKLAADSLGARFDVRAFHDAILGGGALPLDLLELRVRDWIASRATVAAVRD